ncbi:hypothetical protein [Octadecabacter sp. R77987]|uniref:hypothetical protein n=1 Tax=Octadecabacter sp. R77987 TaxID=3093874 RepID=UPI00366EC033
MDETTSLKHASMKDLPLELVQAILRSAVNGRSVGLEEAIRTLDCDAHHADRVLRQMAEAGYLEPADILDGLFYWQLTPNGTRLAMEPKRKRIGRDKVQAIVSELLARAQVINTDPDRLQRITLRLFGSALEKRDDYGDVDVSIAYMRRQLSDIERERVENALKARQSKSDRQTFHGRLMGAERQDTREIMAFLKKGLPHLSLMNDDPMDLGTPYRWLVNHEVKPDRPVDVPDDIVRPNAPSTLDQRSRRPLPPITLIEARHRAISATTKVAIDDMHIGLEDAATLDEKMWSPKVTRKGAFVANDIRSEKRVKFAGFQHLCPIWKQELGGVAMLKEALDWCDEHKVWVRDLFPRVSIQRSDRMHVIRLGLGDDLIYFNIGGKSTTGSLLPRNRTRVSKIDLAGAYAVGKALSKMYDEGRCAKMPWFSAEILLPLVEVEKLPEFPRLLKVGEFHENAFCGLREVELY